MSGTPEDSLVSNYFEQTRRPIYSIIASAPFFIAYELGIIFLYDHQPEEARVKNLAEVLLHQSARLVGKHAAYVLPVVAGIALLYIFHLKEKKRAAAGRKRGGGKPRKSRWQWQGLRPDFLLYIYLEGLILALPLGLLAREVPDVIRLLSSGGGETTGQLLFRLTTMCGAGAYEELLFRLFLFSLFYFLSTRLGNLEKLPAGIVAATASSLLFAVFHGLDRSLSFYVFAVIAGFYLSMICHFRSFGVAVAAHAIYDILHVLTAR